MVKSRSDAEGHRGAPETGRKRKILMTNRLWDFVQSLFSLNAVKHLNSLFYIIGAVCAPMWIMRAFEVGVFFPLQHLFQ